MDYEGWLSYRYFFSSKGRFLTFLNFISIAGIAVGVMALIIVIGVMTGFGNNLRDKIIGTTPHIVVEKEVGVRDYQTVIEQVSTIEGVSGAAPFIQGNIFLEQDGQSRGLTIRGIDPQLEPGVTKAKEYLVKGRIEDLDNGGVIIGSELARYFGFMVGDQITLIAPGSGLKGQGWRYDLKIVGIFKSGMVDYDMNLALCHINEAQKMFDLPAGTASGVGVKLANPYDAKEVKEKMFQLLGYSFLLKSWIDVNQSLFDALYLEKWGLFIILTLMILVASFNIISTLIVTVTSKIQDIGILKSVGASNKSIRKIFTRLGMYIGITGTLLGFIGGVGISYILKTYVRVPSEVYSIDHVPVDLQLFDLAAIISAALVITFLATIYPAVKAGKLQPVEALRYQ